MSYGMNVATVFALLAGFIVFLMVVDAVATAFWRRWHARRRP